MMNKIFISFILMFFSFQSWAQAPTLERVSPLQIDGLNSVKFDRMGTIDFNGEKLLIPTQADWTHNFINGEDKYSVILWDNSYSTLICWFLKEKSGVLEYVGYDSLYFRVSHFNKGPVQLEEPLVPPNNYAYPDSSTTSFGCIDKSFALKRKFTIDWTNKEISSEVCSFPLIDIQGGFPKHSFYTPGLPDSSRRGIFAYRKIYNQYSYHCEDENFGLGLFTNYFNNQYEELPYKISDIVTLAVDDEVDLFMVIDKQAKFIYRNRLGLLATPNERKTTKFPTISPPYPAHLFTKNGSFEVVHTRNPYKPIDEGIPRIEVDTEARVWYSGFSSDKIFVIKNAFFPHSISDFTDTDTTYVVNLPKALPSQRKTIRDINGSVKGYLTITYDNGIETYKIK